MRIGYWFVLLIATLVAHGKIKAPLNFDYLECGEYIIKGKLISKIKENNKKYYLQIYPPKKSFRFKKSRTIEIKTSEIKTSEELTKVAGLDGLNYH